MRRVKVVTYLAGRSLIGSYTRQLWVEKRVGREVTHRGKKLGENYNEIANKNHQEVDGSAFKNVAEKGSYTRDTQQAPFSCTIHDNEKSQAIFDERGLINARERWKEGCNTPYSSERNKNANSPARHDWKRQTWYSSNGSSGICVAFKVEFSFGKFIQGPIKEDIQPRRANSTATYVPKVNWTKVMKERHPAINRFFPVSAYTLSVRSGLHVGQPGA